MTQTWRSIWRDLDSLKSNRNRGSFSAKFINHTTDGLKKVSKLDEFTASDRRYSALGNGLSMRLFYPKKRRRPKIHALKSAMESLFSREDQSWHKGHPEPSDNNPLYMVVVPTELLFGLVTTFPCENSKRKYLGCVDPDDGLVVPSKIVEVQGIMFLRDFLIPSYICIFTAHSIAQSLSNNAIKTSDFIKKYGYPAEEHEVKTKDNYFLTIFRIPSSRNNTGGDRPVVLLQHGIILNSDSWVFRGPEEDLVFYLSDAGYDVWMSNTRGTDYSRQEIYSNKDPEFWNYGVTETGMYDLAAVIDYILQETGKSNLTYVGHSRGNAMMVILLSTQPEYNSKLNLYIGLAPVIYSKEARTPFLRLAATGPFRVTSSASVYDLLKRAKVSNLFRTSRGLRQVMGAVCSPLSVLNNVCSSLLFLVNGDDFIMYNRSLMPLIISSFRMGMSAKEYVHLLQLRESDLFRHFDYGKKRNLKIYGNGEPPSFDISRVRVPTYLYYGPNDLFVSERDLFKFALQLPNLKNVYRIPFDKFNHVDYMWAKVSNTLLYPILMETIGEYNGK